MHVETGHGGRHEIRVYCQDRWVIAKEACTLFVSLCRTCNLKRVMPTKGVVIKLILRDGFNSQGQINLIDLQSYADGKKLLKLQILIYGNQASFFFIGEFHFLMNYQDTQQNFYNYVHSSLKKQLRWQKICRIYFSPLELPKYYKG